MKDQTTKRTTPAPENTTGPIGIIEGFYGKHWPHADRLALAPAFAEIGFDFYIYAPKSDAWLRKAWHESFPRHRLHELDQLSNAYQQQSMGFGVGLSPKDIWLDWGPMARSALKEKIKTIETIDPSILCILLDDMHGDMDRLAHMQCEIMDFIASITKIPKLSFCPTYYSDDPILDSLFGERPQDYLQTLGENIHKSIDIFWTGPKVISRSVPDGHLDTISTRLGRKPLLWDNALANDGSRSSNYLFANPPQDYVPARLNKLAGLMFNPMNQPWLSRHCLQNIMNEHSNGALARGKRLPSNQNTLSADLESLFAARSSELQIEGLNALPPTRIKALYTEFSSYPHYPEVQEVLAWLNAEYRFDPDCLTD